ncbi:hypothetical protein ACWYXN_18525 [Janthinobacterium aestuarii]
MTDIFVRQAETGAGLEAIGGRHPREHASAPVPRRQRPAERQWPWRLITEISSRQYIQLLLKY